MYVMIECVRVYLYQIEHTISLGSISDVRCTFFSAILEDFPRHTLKELLGNGMALNIIRVEFIISSNDMIYYNA